MNHIDQRITKKPIVIKKKTNHRILIVDDEPDILEQLARILKEEGFDVTCASSGQHALKIFKTKQFSLVITDLSMPGMDGLQLLHKIKRLDKDTQVIIMTGFASIKTVIQALKNGKAFDYLTKPMEYLDELLVSVNKAMEQRSLKIKNRKLFNQRENLNAILRKRNMDLEKALLEIKTLKGLIPICSNCKKIRDNKGYWNLLETYITKHCDAQFTHSLCPGCESQFLS
jgi:DNA-binding NtrC family response regulator